MADDNETFIMLLLSDSNLPTGAFVASSGLESYIKHGFNYNDADRTLMTFIRSNLTSYAHTALPFVSDTHRWASPMNAGSDIDAVLKQIRALDDLYHAMTPNHVTRRASESQGVALLTLYSKGFSEPKATHAAPSNGAMAVSVLIDRYKLLIRREEAHGHLPICWGILTGALGLSLERSQHLHLFLQARSLLSAAVRLNEIGPYHSQQILLHLVRPLVANLAVECKDITANVSSKSTEEETLDGPANTWPLGELLAARHDLQHSRIFNS